MGIEKENEDELEKEMLEKALDEMERLEKEFEEKERLERERLLQETLERKKLEQERFERERLERERLENLKMEKKLYPNNSLFIIPSWGDLLGYPTLGTYVHHPVSKIESDIVIFLSGYDYSIETAKGTLHYLFGLGYYFLKFELESGKYVTDSRILTGLILPDFVYDHMATSSNITLEEDREVILAEKVIKVPINLSYKPEDHLTFIKGALMRNVFIPHKDIFLEMMNTIRQTDSYQVSSEGHKLLSSHWEVYNQILVSDKMRAKGDSPYLNPTAGIEGINNLADRILQDTISPINLSIIEDNIKNLKEIYSNIEFDPMYLFSILEKASPMLGTDIPISSKQGDSILSKESVFASAEERLFGFIGWPIKFPRKAKETQVTLPKLVEPPPYEEVKESPIYKLETTDIRNLEQESFKIDTMKSEKVEFKPLPPPPSADIKEILKYLKNVVEGHYEMRSLGQAFEIAREAVRKIGVSATTIHQKKVWEMSKYANIYIKKEPGFGLARKEQSELARKIDEWIFEIEESERLERERLEEARLEKERLERLERERLEQARLEKERLERLERERIEKEKREQERLEAERLEKIRVEKERQEQERARREELERIEREKQEELRQEKERIEKEREEQEALEREKLELKRLKQERKEKEKAAKQEAKKKKKLEKQKKKIEKQKLKEQEKLKTFN